MLHIVIKKPAKPGTRKVKWTLQKHTFEAILNFEYKAFTILPCCFVMSCWNKYYGSISSRTTALISPLLLPGTLNQRLASQQPDHLIRYRLSKNPCPRSW